MWWDGIHCLRRLTESQVELRRLETIEIVGGPDPSLPDLAGDLIERFEFLFSSLLESEEFSCPETDETSFGSQCERSCEVIHLHWS
jgi:hypothetical protein